MFSNNFEVSHICTIFRLDAEPSRYIQEILSDTRSQSFLRRPQTRLAMDLSIPSIARSTSSRCSTIRVVTSMCGLRRRKADLQRSQNQVSKHLSLEYFQSILSNWNLDNKILFKDTTSSLQSTLSKNQTKLHLLSTVFQPYFPTHEQEIRQCIQ